MDNEANTTENAAGMPTDPAQLVGVTFKLPEGLLNIHASCTRQDGNATKAVNFRYKGGVLHVASTNGHVLLYTQIPSYEANLEAQDFDVSFLIERKVRAKGDDFFEIVATRNGNLYLLETGKQVAYPRFSCIYPQYKIILGATETPKAWRAFDPKHLALVKRYLPDGFGAPRVDSTGGAFVWKYMSNCEICYCAVVMPLRIS